MKSALEILREIRARDARRDELVPLNSAEGRLERFLADSSIPVTIMHSRALDRPFILARDGADLDALTAEEQALPVIFFSECEQLQHLEPEDLAAILNVRAVFGPSARLVSITPSDGNGERH